MTDLTPLPLRPKFDDLMERYQGLQAWATALAARTPGLDLDADLPNFCHLLAELQQQAIGEALLGGITACGLEIEGKEQAFFAFAEYVNRHFPEGWRIPLYKLLTLDECYFQGEDNITTDAVYLHKKGSLYVIEQLANLASIHEGFKPSVVYRGIDGQLWTRPIDEFRHRFTYLCDL